MATRHVVLVCGGRDYKDRDTMYRVLDTVHAVRPITRLVQGFARGADTLAHEWAESRSVATTGRKYWVTPAQWRTIGKSAGIKRNIRMHREEQPDLVLAAPGGNGTAQMVSYARSKGTEVIVFDKKGNLV